MPELFMDTLRAKDDKPTEYLMTQMFYYMFPEAQAQKGTGDCGAEKEQEQSVEYLRRRRRWGEGWGEAAGKE